MFFAPTGTNLLQHILISIKLFRRRGPAVSGVVVAGSVAVILIYPSLCEPHGLFVLLPRLISQQLPKKISSRCNFCPSVSCNHIADVFCLIGPEFPSPSFASRTYPPKQISVGSRKFPSYKSPTKVFSFCHPQRPESSSASAAPRMPLCTS